MKSVLLPYFVIALPKSYIEYLNFGGERIRVQMSLNINMNRFNE